MFIYTLEMINRTQMISDSSGRQYNMVVGKPTYRGLVSRGVGKPVLCSTCVRDIGDEALVCTRCNTRVHDRCFSLGHVWYAGHYNVCFACLEWG